MTLEVVLIAGPTSASPRDARVAAAGRSVPRPAGAGAR